MNYDITPFQARAARQLAAAFGHLWATPPYYIIDAERNGNSGALAAWQEDLEATLVRFLAHGVKLRTRATWGEEAWGILAPTEEGEWKNFRLTHESAGKRISWSISREAVMASVHSGSMSYSRNMDGSYRQSGPVVTVFKFAELNRGELLHVTMHEGHCRDDHADLAGRIMEALELPLDPRIVAARERLRAAEIAEREHREAARAAELAAMPHAEPPQAEPVPEEYRAYFEPPWLTEARAQ